MNLKSLSKFAVRKHSIIGALLFIALCGVAVATNGQKEISEMNLLLPVSPCTSQNQLECRSAKHELFAFNGCYTWEISHPHMIEMKPGKTRGDCVDSVILTPLLHRESKTLIWITARDKSSGQVLESQAKIGLLESIAVNINYRHLYINDKKHIDVVAFDDQGNIFSGLDGFRFDWTITSGAEHIKFIQKPDGYLHKRSSEGTDVAFVKGLKAGQAELNVKILEPGYENVNDVSVTIMVVDPFIISPQKEIFILPTSKFNYDLLQIRKQDNGEVLREQIKVPNTQYLWLISNETIGVQEQSGVFTSSIYEGTQSITVIDQQMVNNTAEAQLQVVFPYKVTMAIHDVTHIKAGVQESLAEAYGISLEKPSESKILVEERTYLVLLSLWDKDDNRILLTDNVVMESKNLLDQVQIERVKVSKIGSEILFKTRRIDKDVIKLQTSYALKEVKSMMKDTKFELRQFQVDAELMLTKPVQIQHPTDFILLPYLQAQGQIWHTQAIGGSGVYSWSVENPELVHVEGSCVLKSLKVGKTRLIVQDHRNPQNVASIDVEVAPIAQLKWLEDQLELRAGNQGQLATLNVIALDRQGRKFTNCTEVNLEYKTGDQGNVVALVSQTNQLTFKQLTTFVTSNVDLLTLKQRFEENSQIVYASDLTQQMKMSKDVLQHNNFGICAQQQVSAGVEGLARVKVVFKPKDDKSVESEFAELAVYKQLQTISPNASAYFSDLYSKSQIGQEFTTMDHLFSPDIVSMIAGTEMIWSVSGGTNFWKDYSDKYIVEWSIEGTQPKCVSLSKDKVSVTNFDIKIKCQPIDLTQINHLNVTMNQNSKQSRHLLQPAQHSIKVKVECGVPKQTRLLWAQQNSKDQFNLPNSRIHENERVHYALVNSKHYVKSLVFDGDSLAYLNSSSIIAKVVSSDPSVASVSVDSPFSQAIAQDRYAKRVVQFNNKTGTVLLRSELSAYINSMVQVPQGYFSSIPKDTSAWNLGELTSLPSTLSDTLKVEVVRKLQVEPRFKSLYIGSQSKFKLTILEGSGHFTVTPNNTEIAEVVHKDREIFVSSKFAGMLELSIYDVELPGSEPFKAYILLSDIAELNLWSPSSLMEQDDSMNLIVSAFDSQGNDFDVDQYIDMRFSIETEMTGVIRKHGLKTESTPLNTVFKANGNEPGIYQLTAYTRRLSPGGSSNIVSEMIRVEVFPLLEIYPPSLLITPNMRFTLQIQGGPQTSVQSFQNGSSIEIKFEIEETEIATVDLNREVTGMKVGDATLKYQIIQQRTQKTYTPRGVPHNETHQVESRVVSKKSVSIRVRLITAIEIPLANQRQIYTGSLVKMNAVLKHEQEYFNHGIAPISFSWNCTSSRTLNLELPLDAQKNRRLRNNVKNDETALFTSTFNSSSVYATAGKEGDAKVFVLVAIDYPQEYKSNQNWFVGSATVKVTEQLKIQVNEFSSSTSEGTHMYLIPPNTVGHIQTNIDTKLKLGYSIVSEYDHSTNSFRSEEATSPIVKLVNNKAIQTFDKYGKVTVIVEQGGQAFSDQVAMLNVFISDIYSMQAMNTYDSLNLPLGSSFKLPIHFQNEHANRFANNVEGIKIGFSLSHPRVLQVHIDEFKQELTIKSQGSGDCNIMIFLEDHPQVFDLIRVKVSSIVRPLSPVNLHVGGQVEFRAINPDDQSKDDTAHWKSSEISVLQIEQSGRAVGLSEGRAEVMLSNHINAASIVHVGRILFGQIEHQNALILNTDTESRVEDLRVRIKLHLTKNDEEVMPTVQYDGITLIRQNIGILCTSDQPEYVQAQGEISDLEGFFCVLRYKKDADAKSMPRFVKVSVNAYSLLPGSSVPLYSDQIAQFEVQLLSSIKVEKRFKNGITLTRANRQESVHIFSSSDFNVAIEYTQEVEDVYIKQKVTRQDVNSNDYNLTVIVPAEVTKDFKANIVLTHPYTQFKRILPLTFKYEAEAPQKVVQQKSAPKTTQKPSQPEYENMTQGETYNQGRSWSSYLAILLVGLATIAFILHNWTNVNVFAFLNGNQRNGRDNRPSRNRPVEMNYGAGIREPQGRSYPRKNLNYTQSSAGFSRDMPQQNQMQSAAGSDVRRPRQLPTQNLDRFSGRGLDRSGGDPSRVSLYSNSLDNSRF